MFSSGKIKIPGTLRKMNSIFASHGFKAYLVGGAVRDMIMGKPCHDWDVATDATPADVMRIFHKVIPTGIAHGTVTVRILGSQIETTTFRTEAAYSDGRHPDSVSYASTIEEDLSRRDFTMNAMAAELGSGKLVDPFGGQRDIADKIIRTVGSPHERFSEDGLRPVRAVRFASQLGFSIEAETLKALSDPAILRKVSGISVERFRDEFCKLLMSQKPSVGLRLLESSGMLGIFIPEFTPCRNCSQRDDRGFHEFDVADHIFYSCDSPCVPYPLSDDDSAEKGTSLTVRLSAFYHDIGKPAVRTEETVASDGGNVTRVHFHGHEAEGERICRESMSRLKFSNDEIKRVSHLVREHMFNYESVWSDAAVRRFIIRIGEGNLGDIIALRVADIHGMHNVPLDYRSPAWKLLTELMERVERLKAQKMAGSLKDLAVDGKDLIAAGIPPGKSMGLILNELFAAVTDSPEMNEKERLIPLALSIYRTRFS